MILQSGKPEEAGMSAKQIDRLEKTILRWVNEGYSPAMTYLVARHGIIVSHGAAGIARQGDNSIPLSKDALFPVASITKLFTATAIMILTEEGLLSPVSRVQDYIPEFRGEDKEDVFISHLLTHTSGLADETIWKYAEEIKENTVIPPAEKTQDPDIHKRLYLGYGTPLTYKIGTYMSYCNYGYELLGEIVRRVSHMSLDNFFRERILEPLGMKDTYLVVPEEQWGRAVSFPENSIGAEWLSTPGSFLRPSAAGGFYSTVYDMSIFGQMFLNEGVYGSERILSKASVRAMVRNHTKAIPSGWGSIRFPESGWGLGFMISIDKKDESGTLRSPDAFSHSGWGCTYLFMDPVYDIVMACFQVTTKIQEKWLNRRFDIFTDVALAGIEN